MTSAAFAAYAYADTQLARLVDAARAAGCFRITFVIASDHGFGNVKQAIRPNAVLAQRGILIKQDGKYAGAAWFLAEGGEASLYIRDKTLRSTLVPQLKSYFTAMPGVDGAYSSDEAKTLGLPAVGTTDQAHNLYLTAKPDYAFWSGEDGPLTQDVSPLAGSHGYSSSDQEMQALFVMEGAHIRAGVDLGTISNLRVAPTIAKLLGISLPASTQAPLDEAMR